ncbi:Melanoma-associated antigen B4 [Galemys pyrenaicus]|uniref:Melanoma-associated antigen B4 n=1 Tax=Galemys pyrenaicus TaxID=202257 RepID=A0A8J5ZWH9_GALPY|nr:Melanoma-associated antigen B4 [Galemys pyrenaicus]
MTSSFMTAKAAVGNPSQNLFMHPVAFGAHAQLLSLPAAMPRGQKSKQRAREKRRQAKSEHRSIQAAQATAAAAAAAEEPPSSSASDAGDPGASPAAAGTPQESQRARAPSPDAESSSSSSSDEDERSLGASASSPSSLKDPLTRKAGVLVQFLLQKYRKKEPITRAEMLKVVKKKYKEHFPEILRRACDRMELVFGIDVKEGDPDGHSYVLVSKMALPSKEDLEGADLGLPKNGLLLPLLGMIFMSGDRISEEEMWKFLNVLGIHDGRRHFIFGEPRKLITQDLVQEQYLEYRQVPGSDPPRYEFLWGLRAYAETSKMKVLEFLAKVSNTVPSSFQSRYEAALRDEEERTQARAADRAATGATNGAPSRPVRAPSPQAKPKAEPSL